MTAKSFLTTSGKTKPLGASTIAEGTNFAIFSENATAVTLCLFDEENLEAPLQEIPLVRSDISSSVWHICVIGLPEDALYLYRVEGPIGLTHRFNKDNYLLDPYAKIVQTTNNWGDNTVYSPKGAIPSAKPFDWEGIGSPGHALKDLVIYEMHIRAFTEHPSSKSLQPGSFLGVIEKIPHLVDLGIKAVELMPVFEFNECEYAKSHPFMKYPLFNFWGYSTVNFFAPMQRYAHSPEKDAAIIEFKTMVKEFHRNGIEVILDVVYNHTAEGNENGPTINLKGIDNASYYYLDAKGKYIDFSGCGNTLNCSKRNVQEMILDSLRYWVTEMHVDGFRFDLASILTRGPQGQPLAKPPLIDAITNDPVLANVKLIAEAWDAAGLYQVGSMFPQFKKWSEWNGRYRDAIRRFIKGGDQKGQFITNLCGSQDLYYNNSPACSINFVTAHDGFTLADLVSYNFKHNMENGEDNRDGSNYNESWNCGIEGLTQSKGILEIRDRQMRNFHFALMISRGIPMVLMGDEYGHTKRGNNNTWCQDNDLNWFLWDQLKSNQEFYQFYRALIHFRNAHPRFRENSFYTNEEIDWHGKEPLKPNWNTDGKFIAFTLKDLKKGHDFYIAFNADSDNADIVLPTRKDLKQWRWVINTASPSPYDFREEASRTFIVKYTYRMQPFSAILLEAMEG